MKFALPLLLASLAIGLATVSDSAAQLAPSHETSDANDETSPQASVETQKSEKKKQKNKGRYAVASVSLNSAQWAAIRYQRDTGKSWSMDEGKWVAIKELKQLRPEKHSEFEIQLMSASVGHCSAIRLDKNSGQCWELKDDTWHPIIDEAD